MALDETNEAWLEPERLDVYRLSVELQSIVERCRFRNQSSLRVQLERASTSIALNIAEGAGRRLPADKARFYSIARGSAMECAAIFDIARVRRLVPEDVCRQARTSLLRIVQMLTRLEMTVLARMSAGE